MHEDVFPEVPTSEEDDARIVGIPRAQALLGGITRREVTNMVRRGELQKVKIGRRSMIVRASIDARIDRAIAEASAAVAA